MKPEAQRIAIAEACEKIPAGFSHHTLAGFASLLPDYLNSLDAMHEAENVRIIPLDSSAFYDAIQEIMGRDLGLDIICRGTGFSGWIAHATAAQRAEALLKTLNLWTE